MAHQLGSLPASQGPGPESPPLEADAAVHDEAAEPFEYDDNDSAFEGSIDSSTASLSDSILEYRRIHGRTYQNAKTTEYWAPNDDQQNQGLDLIHNGLLMLLEDRLFLAPLGDDLGRVLDIGTGTGIWAIDVGDQFPSADIIGTDISPIQPQWLPPNVSFIIDDCLLDWTWPSDHFDLINVRAMYGSIPDWEQLFRRAYHHLKPGGWVHDLELGVHVQSDHVPLPADHVFRRWARVFYEGGAKMGRSFAVAEGHLLRDSMESAGFVDVVETKLKAPLHSWPKDPRLQRAGLMFNMALEESLEGFGIFLMTQVLDWRQEEAVVLIAQMRSELRKRSNCAWCETQVLSLE